MRTGRFKGWRAMVTTPDGQSSWVDLPRPGAPTHIEDQLAGGTLGGLWRAKRVPPDPQSLDQYGYNQVCCCSPAALRQGWTAHFWQLSGSKAHRGPAGRGTMGGLWWAKRVPPDPQSLDQYGYNQVSCCRLECRNGWCQAWRRRGQPPAVEEQSECLQACGA